MTKKHSNKRVHKDKDETIEMKKADAYETNDWKHYINKTWNFVQSPAFLITLLIIIPLFLSIWFRAYPSYLPITNDFAQQTAVNNIKSQVASQVNQQYPLLPDSEKNKLVDQQLDQVMAKNKANFDEQIAVLSNQFKSKMQNDNNQTYLLAIDPYQHLRRTRNLVEKGTVGDLLVDGKAMNNHQLAPLVRSVGNEFQVSAIYYSYKLVSFFKKNVSLMAVSFWLPLLFAALAVIPAFFLGRRKGFLTGGFVTALLIAVHAGFISRTSAGFSDTDAYVILFPLLITWMLFLALDSDKWKNQLIFGGLAGFFALLFAYAWKSWFYMTLSFGFFIAYMAYRLIRNLLLKNKDYYKEKRFLKATRVFGTYFLSSGLLITLFMSLGKFMTFLTKPLEAFTFKAAVNVANLWPNVLTTVAELNNASISSIISNTGASAGLSKIFFFLSLLGLTAILLPKKLELKDYSILGLATVIDFFLVSPKGVSFSIMTYLLIAFIPIAVAFIAYWKDKRDIDFKQSMFLVMWFFGAMFTMTQGVRFVLLLIPPFAISLGILLGRVSDYLQEVLSKEFEISKKLVAVLLFIVIALMFIPTIRAGQQQGYNQIPSMNDAWWNSLNKINQEAAPNAIVNSWWDFGHWFKYVADRGVTFDGASQNTPAAHWIGNTLLTNNESVALANLRMLDCGNYLGVKDLQSAGLEQYDAILLMKKIIMLSKDKASSLLLSKGLTQEQTTQVLNHTHCSPPEDYFITSQDMVGKAGVWGHFGSWNFTRAAISTLRKKPIQEATTIMQEKYGFSQEEATNLYYEMLALKDEQAVNSWISPWPGYVSSLTNCVTDKTNITTCSIKRVLNTKNGVQTVLEGAVIDEKNKTVKLSIGAYRDGQKVSESQLFNPKRAIFAYQDSYEEQVIDKVGLPGIGVLFDVPENKLLLADPLLIDSTFTKLFYLDGRYMPHFEKFSDVTSFRGERIIVWKVDWPKEWLNY